MGLFFKSTKKLTSMSTAPMFLRNIKQRRSFTPIAICGLYTAICLLHEKNKLPFQVQLKQFFAYSRFYYRSLKDSMWPYPNPSFATIELFSYLLTHGLLADDQATELMTDFDPKQEKHGSSFSLIKALLKDKGDDWVPSDKLAIFAENYLLKTAKKLNENALPEPIFEIIFRKNFDRGFEVLTDYLNLPENNKDLEQFTDQGFFRILGKSFWTPDKRDKVVQLYSSLSESPVFSQIIIDAGLVDELGPSENEQKLKQKLIGSETYKIKLETETKHLEEKNKLVDSMLTA